MISVDVSKSDLQENVHSENKFDFVIIVVYSLLFPSLKFGRTIVNFRDESATSQRQLYPAFDAMNCSRRSNEKSLLFRVDHTFPIAF
jgi:hypothetical protein